MNQPDYSITTQLAHLKSEQSQLQGMLNALPASQLPAIWDELQKISDRLDQLETQFPQDTTTEDS